MKLATFGNGRNTIAPFKNLVDKFWGTDKFYDDDFFHFRNQWMPAVNIKDNKNEFDIQVAAPGLEKKDFKVTVDNGILCITAEKETKVEEKEDNYTRQEFNYNSFERSFTLPENVDADHIDAKYDDGILKLRLKKTMVDKPNLKKIAIK
jgi:HSP20 family protein